MHQVGLILIHQVGHIVIKPYLGYQTGCSFYIHCT